ncbi:MAG TPA: DJ-1/PfpI family protein [Kofleriaceae bacterium]|nr:DJ-1/PfpI family protein [Kofleriaceae bacterium]
MKILLVTLCLLVPVTARASRADYTRNVAIVLYDGVELLDFAGPGEVFQAASGFGASSDGPAFKVFTVAKTRSPIISQGFVKVTPEYSIRDAPRIDIIVFPGGGSDGVTEDPEMMRWVRERSKAAQLTVTVCTGAMIMAKAGLLDGRDATTWYGAIDSLRERAPRTRVHNGRRFIDSGNVVTTAGVSAGIDGSLHVVARLLGRNVADRTAQYMEYSWHPEPYLANSYSIWNPRLDAHGQRLQQALVLVADKRWKEAEVALRRLLREKDDGAAWYQLGYVLHASGRIDDAIPAHKRAAKFPAMRKNALYNLAGAYATRKRPGDALTALEGAVAAGFDHLGMMQSDSELASLRGTPRFEKLVARLKQKRR